MTTHLPPEEYFAEYASGATTPGLTLLMAAHLTHSAQGRERVAAYEALCGAMLHDEAPSEMANGALDDVLCAIDAISPATPRDDAAAGAGALDAVQRAEACGPLPAPLQAHIGIPFDDIPWKFRLPGVAVYDLEGFGDQKVQILKARPGAAVPQHTHNGTELTLVLQGVLEDNGVEYREGDVAINDEDDDHRPRILGTEMCYCLIVQQGDLHFTGKFSRILNYLGE
ncbi:MAG: ChrR family anti-sigma-E factor [Pseudomonadota bacterium]